MTRLHTVALIALGALLILGAIVAGVLRHHIGGFIRTVEREAEEERRRRDEEDALRASTDNPEDAGRL